MRARGEPRKKNGNDRWNRRSVKSQRTSPFITGVVEIVVEFDIHATRCLRKFLASRFMRNVKKEKKKKLVFYNYVTARTARIEIDLFYFILRCTTGRAKMSKSPVWTTWSSCRGSTKTPLSRTSKRDTWTITYSYPFSRARFISTDFFAGRRSLIREKNPQSNDARAPRDSLSDKWNMLLNGPLIRHASVLYWCRLIPSSKCRISVRRKSKYIKARWVHGNTIHLSRQFTLSVNCVYN